MNEVRRGGLWIIPLGLNGEHTWQALAQAAEKMTGLLLVVLSRENKKAYFPQPAHSSSLVSTTSTATKTT